MMSFILKALAALVLLLWLAPVLAGLMDVSCWFALGHGCTAIPWGADGWIRAGVAIIWPMLFGLVAVPLACALYDSAGD
jgi:hypothetical protein